MYIVQCTYEKQAVMVGPDNPPIPGQCCTCTCTCTLYYVHVYTCTCIIMYVYVIHVNVLVELTLADVSLAVVSSVVGGTQTVNL